MAIFFYRMDLQTVGIPTLIYRLSIHSKNSFNKYHGGLRRFHMLGIAINRIDINLVVFNFAGNYVAISHLFPTNPS